MDSPTRTAFRGDGKPQKINSGQTITQRISEVGWEQNVQIGETGGLFELKRQQFCIFAVLVNSKIRWKKSNHINQKIKYEL